jgi:F0F1-type ATP synthase assembly protein I
LSSGCMPHCKFLRHDAGVNGHHEKDVREAVAVALGVMYGGAVLLVLIDRIFGLDATAGVIGFALPLVAALVVIHRLERRPRGNQRTGSRDR